MRMVEYVYKGVFSAFHWSECWFSISFFVDMCVSSGMEIVHVASNEILYSFLF